MSFDKHEWPRFDVTMSDDVAITRRLTADDFMRVQQENARLVAELERANAACKALRSASKALIDDLSLRARLCGDIDTDGVPLLNISRTILENLYEALAQQEKQNG